MNLRSKSLVALICFPILFAVPSFAQGVARPPANAAVLDRSPGVPQNTNSTDPIANEISLFGMHQQIQVRRNSFYLFICFVILRCRREKFFADRL